MGSDRTVVKSDNQEHISAIDARVALEVVYEAIREVNTFRSPSDTVPLRPDVLLVGENGCLDSMEMTTLVLAAERRILEIASRHISFLDGADFESELSAFHSPQSLADLIVAKCTE
jgi:hypothetical protein